MDLKNLQPYIWNILVLFLLYIPGTFLDTTDNNDNTRDIKKNLQLEIIALNSMATISKMSSSLSTTIATRTTTTATTTATKAMWLSSLTTTGALLSLKRDTINDTTVHEQDTYPHKQSKRRRQAREDYNKKFLENMTIARTKTTARQTKSLAKDDDFVNIHVNNDDKSAFIQHKYNEPFSNDSKEQHSQDMVAYTFPKKESFHSPLQSTKTTNSLVSLLRAERTLVPTKLMKEAPSTPIQMATTTLSNTSRNGLYGSNQRNTNNSKSISHGNYYHSDGQTTSIIAITATSVAPSTALNSLDKDNRATTTTSTIATSHKINNKSTLSYIEYESAALKAPHPPQAPLDLKTLHNSILYSSFKDDKPTLLLSLGNIKSAASIDNSSLINSSNVHNVHDTNENHLKMARNFKSNNSLEQESMAMKKTTETQVFATTSAINETTLSLPLLNASTLSTRVASLSVTKSYQKPSSTSPPPPTAITTTTAPTLKTTRRRKIATTTLKPPPTIDDYQTITSQAGTHAYLPCNVKQLVKKPISWLRVRDGHILTVDQTTFIADQRFQSIYTTNPERWSLQIKYIQLKDAGIYECQVSTEPKASAIVYLHVVEPKTELIGAPTRHVKAGSQVKLLCIISQALEPPLFINWFYNQKQIYLHNRKGWRTEIERIELPPETTTTTTTSTTTTTTTSTTTQTTTTSTSTTSSSPPYSTTSAMKNGSELSAMHVFTSITPQQSLNDGNLLESVSDSTYNNYHDLIQPEAASILTTSKTHTPTTSTILLKSKSVSVGTTLPTASPTDTTTTATFEDDDDYQQIPALTTFETFGAAIAAGRGNMMLSSLMKVTDVKQITTASLIIPSVQKQDSGNYTCSPSNSVPRTVILHVLNGEYSASAITSAGSILNIQYTYLKFIFSIFIIVIDIKSQSVFTTNHIIRRYSGG